jgi:hypothetical protein
MAKPKKSMTIKEYRDSMVEKLDTLNTVVLGNGNPERGLVVTMVRMEQKLDAFLDHMEDKAIHRTSGAAIANMLKVALVIVPAVLAIVVGIGVLTHVTLAGDWVKVGELISHWLQFPPPVVP